LLACPLGMARRFGMKVTECLSVRPANSGNHGKTAPTLTGKGAKAGVRVNCHEHVYSREPPIVRPVLRCSAPGSPGAVDDVHYSQ
jgi:hypothetical protein